MITVLYFARIREALDLGDEKLEFDQSLNSVATLKAMLMARGPKWAQVLADDQGVLVAVNQEMAGSQHTIEDGDEVAFFPPVTGG